jgi:hypothetical protein
MKKIYLLMFCFVILGITKTFSCSCFSGYSLSAEFEEATAVFTATVIEKELSDAEQGSYNYTLKVLRTWKGTVNEFVTTHQLNSAACGVYYYLDSTYLIFAYSNTSDIIHTTSCNINMSVSFITNEIEELNELSSITNTDIHNQDYRGITVFPNPSRGMVRVKSTDKQEYVSIYDYNGRVIWQQYESGTEIILPELKSGIYLFVAYRNGIRYSQKFQIL